MKVGDKVVAFGGRIQGETATMPDCVEVHFQGMKFGEYAILPKECLVPASSVLVPKFRVGESVQFGPCGSGAKVKDVFLSYRVSYGSASMVDIAERDLSPAPAPRRPVEGEWVTGQDGSAIFQFSGGYWTWINTLSGLPQSPTVPPSGGPRFLGRNHVPVKAAGGKIEVKKILSCSNPSAMHDGQILVILADSAPGEPLSATIADGFDLDLHRRLWDQWQAK